MKSLSGITTSVFLVVMLLDKQQLSRNGSIKNKVDFYENRRKKPIRQLRGRDLKNRQVCIFALVPSAALS